MTCKSLGCTALTATNRSLCPDHLAKAAARSRAHYHRRKGLLVRSAEYALDLYEQLEDEGYDDGGNAHRWLARHKQRTAVRLTNEEYKAWLASP